MKNTLVLLPTLDEVDNIAILISKITNQYPDIHILVVDGASEDGTIESVYYLQKRLPNLYIIVQEKNSGYGNAIRLGFKKALADGYERVITMDADLSHDPKHIADFLKLQDEHGFILGSRYINGVRVNGWQFRKLLVSKLANMYISYVMVRPIWDFTSGYRLYKRAFLKSIEIDAISDYAYILQIQLLDWAYKYKFHVKEVPITFYDRYPGRSKIAGHSLTKTLRSVFRFRAPWMEIIRHLAYVKKDYKRFVDEYDELVNPPKLKPIEEPIVTRDFNISIGVMAYNEEQLIGSCLDALLAQKTNSGRISEIIVISSGSTDNTNTIVESYLSKDVRIKLIVQQSRLGKASAINEFLQIAKGDIVVIESSDTVTKENSIEKLIRPFTDPGIGMSGAHPIPVNQNKKMIDYFVHKLWALHHQLAMQKPKCGEMIAIRNIIQKIPSYTAVDEAVIEATIHQAGYNLAYVPEAIVNNKGPETIRDFIKQRRRIAAGHLHLKATMNYKVSTLGVGTIFRNVLDHQSWRPRDVYYTILLIFVEAWSRFISKIDYYFRDKNPFIWDISQSTKKM